jgi:hypothetical protein
MSQTKSQLIEGSTASELTAAKTLLGAGSAGAPSLTATGDTNTGIFFPTADTLAASTAGSERLRITSAGLVGIGTTSPGSAFEVKPSASSATLGIQAGTINTDSIRIQSGGTANTYLEYRGYLGHAWFVDATEYARIDSSGRLLVGTPSARTIFDSTASLIQVETTSNANRGISLTHNINSAAGTYLQFAKTRGSGNAIVSANDVLGTIIFGGADGTNVIKGAQVLAEVDGTPGANDMPSRLVFATTADGASTPTERMRLDSGGDFLCVGIYNNTTASAANVRVASSGKLDRSTSSAKYKTSIETLEDSYADAILACRPVWYRSICKNDNPDYGWWGFIAEEVATIDPRLVHWKTVEVTYDEKGSAVQTPCDPEPEGVAYDRFVPHLLNLIKRQGEAIADLQAEVAALKAQ